MVSILMVLMVTVGAPDDGADAVSFPPDTPEAEVIGSIDAALEPDAETESDPEMVPVGTADGPVLGSVFPEGVVVSLIEVIDGVSLGVSMGVVTVGGSVLESTGSAVVMIGVGSGVGPTEGSTTGSVTDGTGCIETSCASTEVTSKVIIMNKARMMSVRYQEEVPSD
jgi:hypothetical protein